MKKFKPLDPHHEFLNSLLHCIQTNPSILMFSTEPPTYSPRESEWVGDGRIFGLSASLISMTPGPVPSVSKLRSPRAFRDSWRPSQSNSQIAFPGARPRVAGDPLDPLPNLTTGIVYQARNQILVRAQTLVGIARPLTGTAPSSGGVDMRESDSFCYCNPNWTLLSEIGEII